jgi:outer membrane receptor for ferrienterochelin and colicins
MKKHFYYILLVFSGILSGEISAQAQNRVVIELAGKGEEAKTVNWHLFGPQNQKGLDSSSTLRFQNLPSGQYRLVLIKKGFENAAAGFVINQHDSLSLTIRFKPVKQQEEEVVVTGTLKPVKRTDSPVPVEVYKPGFFKKNPTSNICEAMQQVNGVRPQLNCNVCNTGDIRINGLAGPYTMVLIDGMPIVSSLSTVYGLSGIPNALIERVELVKGPASSLYGSEAVSGLINIITKKPANAPLFSADLMMTSWLEKQADIGFTKRIGNNINTLTGINYYNYNNPQDQNEDGFTDLALQDRISIFQKWQVNRKDQRVLHAAVRYYYEDRFGGDMRWNKSFRGGDSIYGESIYTSRWEALGQYQLPFREKMMLSFSYNDHRQNSVYGNTAYLADQQTAFAQLTWDKKIRNHDLLAGIAWRYTRYDDNSPATELNDGIVFRNNPERTHLPGIFLQDEMNLHKKHKLLLGFRYDQHPVHGPVYTPRIAYKWQPDNRNFFRLNAGTGFRVVNLFTEDHAALTGARKVDILSALNPESSYNINLNYNRSIYTGAGHTFNIDLTGFYTYFNNRIVPDYETDVNKIIYTNLSGYAESRGVNAGVTWMDQTLTENGITTRPLLTERFTATWAVSYTLQPLNLQFDYTGNLYGPMLLPLLGELDPRSPESPWWSLQNLQFTYKGLKKMEVYGGVKNLLNWLPSSIPFLIARTHDPFDKQVQFDNNGQVVATAENPYALTFDPNYVFAPNQGRRFFIGMRFSLK